MERRATEIEQDFLEQTTRHQAVIHKICRIYADSPEDRRDLFQEILYQLWRGYPSFQGKSAFSTWMYQIALNTAITSLRKQTRKPQHVQWEEGLSGQPASGQSLERRRQLQELYRAIRSLGRIDRALVMLYLEDLSYREMAEVMGLSENNIGVRLNRIRARLQDLIRQP